MKGDYFSMKKLIIFSIMLLSMFTIYHKAYADPNDSKILSQGFYKLSDINLSTGSNYSVRNLSDGKALILILDSNQIIQQFIRIEPHSPSYTLKPFNYGDIIIIVGSVNLEFT